MIRITHDKLARAVEGAQGKARRAKGMADALAGAVYEAAGKIPPSGERPANDPARRADELINRAAGRAAVISGSLALPGGPLGIITILPDLLAIWRIQAQLVADVAAVHARGHDLTRQMMMYCLFRHAAAQAVRELVLNVGERLVVRTTNAEIMRRAAGRIGLGVGERLGSRALARVLPVVGAVGVGAFAYYDTTRVGRTAKELFGRPWLVESPPKL